MQTAPLQHRDTARTVAKDQVMCLQQRLGSGPVQVSVWWSGIGWRRRHLQAGGGGKQRCYLLPGEPGPCQMPQARGQFFAGFIRQERSPHPNGHRGACALAGHERGRQAEHAHQEPATWHERCEQRGAAVQAA